MAVVPVADFGDGTKAMLVILSRTLKHPTLRITSTVLGGIRFRTTSTWSSAIRNSSSPCHVLQLYSQMQRKSIPFDSYSILFTLKSCTNLRNLTVIHHLHAHILKLGFKCNVYVATSMVNAYVVASFDHACLLFDEMAEKNVVTWNTMVSGYVKLGCVDKAKLVFDEMPLRNLSSYSSMIGAYLNNGRLNEGLMLSRALMMDVELKADEVTLGVILSACGCMGSVAFVLGKSVHGFAIRNCWVLNVEHGTVLVDMYAKCGFLKYACLVFDRMQERNVKTWTALICGSAHHGYHREAMHLFDKMQEMGVRPNEFTFTGILNSCVQGGLVEEGRRYFKLIEEHELRPSIQHYGCMVDLFGKAGELGEAYEVIMTMPLEPNVVIWGSFLSSCKVHKQFEIAEKVIERVMSMVRPDNDGGVYTLIADLYILGDKWDAAERVRKLMLKQNVKKVRGSSFINSKLQ